MTKEIILKTKKDLASYYMDREFAETNFEMLKELDKGNGEIEAQNPSDEYYFKEFMDSDLKYSEYKETIETIEDLDNDGNEEMHEEFEEFMQERKDDNYPMWNTVWRIKGSNWATEYYEKNVDKLKDIGIGLLEFKDEYYLFIAGAGYNFYQAHWIPLFTKFFTWIDEDCGKELKAIEIIKDNFARFAGSDELKKFLIEKVGIMITDNVYPIILIDCEEANKKIENKNIRKELDLLIKEMKNNNFLSLIIE